MTPIQQEMVSLQVFMTFTIWCKLHRTIDGPRVNTGFISLGRFDRSHKCQEGSNRVVYE